MDFGNLDSKKVWTCILLPFCFFMASSIGYVIVGSSIGILLHPGQHKHHYECACDQSPFMTEDEATVFGIIFVCLLLACSYLVLHLARFGVWSKIAMMVVLLVIALLCVPSASHILYEPPIC